MKRRRTRDPQQSEGHHQGVEPEDHSMRLKQHGWLELLSHRTPQLSNQLIRLIRFFAFIYQPQLVLRQGDWGHPIISHGPPWPVADTWGCWNEIRPTATQSH